MTASGRQKPKAARNVMDSMAHDVHNTMIHGVGRRRVINHSMEFARWPMPFAGHATNDWPDIAPGR